MHQYRIKQSRFILKHQVLGFIHIMREYKTKQKALNLDNYVNTGWIKMTFFWKFK